MKVLIGMGHPAHLHFFKNTIWNLEKDGHEVKIVVRPRKVALELVKAYGFDYELFGEYRNKVITKVLEIPYNDYIFYKVAREFKPDILTGILNYTSAHIGKLIRKPSIVFTDTEDAKLANELTFPFASTICTPSCFLKNIGKKHVQYNGYHELAYLHPKYFKPELTVSEKLGLSENDKFIILRFVSWGAAHDINLKGIDRESELDFIKSLEQYGSVFITSERKLDARLEKYRLRVPPEKIHSLLYYAQLYIGEGGTMAAEAAILGTPAIHIESTSSGLATGELSGNFIELRDKYGLLYFYPDQNQALEKAISILEDENSKTEWQKKREKLLADKIDVTAWMTDFIESYPESFYEYKEKYRGGENVF